MGGVCGCRKSYGQRPCWQVALLQICWIVCFPFILIWHSVEKFLLPCMMEYVFVVFSLCCFKCSSMACGWLCGDMRFTDRRGPHIGGEFEKDVDVEWIRASDIVKAEALKERRHAANAAEGGGASNNDKRGEDGQQDEDEGKVVEHLFESSIEPGDIAQGSLGDCWLLSAIAVLAEKKGQIERVFRERTHSIWGKYHIRLFNGRTKSWQTIVIDDFVPCKNKCPLFTKPKGNEMWVLLLEKAFAKLVGTYAALEGGMSLWALEALTGEHVAHFKLTERTGKWQKMSLVHLEDDDNKRKAGLREVAGESYSTNDFYDILERYEKQGAAMAASSKGKSDKNQASGIVQGHAYSILNVRHVSRRRFLKLRNPWGTFSWEGDWSDKSDLWGKHPEVASALKMTKEEREAKDDGEFWMMVEDFVKFFHGVDILDRDVDIDTVVLEINEDDGRCLAPLKGCAKGCFGYYCRCEGARLLCCPHRSSEQTTKVKKCCGVVMS